MQYYTGIGSRGTPESVLNIMDWLAGELAFRNYILRSGGASGADQAFEKGVSEIGIRIPEDYVEIYLPWPSFEIENRSFIKPTRYDPQEEAFEVAKEYHPSWNKLSQGAKKLHARNVHQVLGYDVTKPELSSFIICWTEGAKGEGGTGQALRIARAHKIPIYDLADESVLLKLTERIFENAQTV